MKHTQDELKTAILSIAKEFCQEESIKALIDSNIGMPKMTEIIIYKMFLNKFNSYFCSDSLFENYKIILEYVEELNEKGFVEFKK